MNPTESTPPRRPETAPKRVRVTSPRRTAARPGPVRPLSRELSERTGLGEVYVDTLMRQQRRAALVVLSCVAVVIGGAATLLGLSPALMRLRLGAVPLSWLVLGVLVYPVLLIAALVYLRTAERIERDFGQLRRG